MLKFSTRCGKYFEQPYSAQLLESALLILDFSHQVILIVAQQERSNQERSEAFRSWGQGITRGLSDRSPHAVGSRGKAPVWGSGGLRLPEAVG